ncbi:tRNA splicing endonuclease 54 [Thoreauomyces humboldtii]|nr:tRNA splicing endonuclease 54 [Thoreauomyces humboldtii]
MADADNVEAEDADYRWLLSGGRTQLVRGTKHFGPDGSAEQQTALDDSRDALRQILLEERTSIRTLSEGVWLSDRCLTRVSVAKGNQYQFIGSSINGQKYLNAEETLFMVERNSLLLTHLGGLVSVQHAFDLIMGDSTEHIDVDTYLVYVYLKRLGYIVFRPETRPKAPLPKAGKDSPRSSAALGNQYSGAVRRLRFFPMIKHAFIAVIASIARLFTFTGWFSRLSSSWPICDVAGYGSSADIFRRLRIIPRLSPTLKGSAKEAKGQLSRPALRPLRAFDVYKPHPHFRKSEREAPDFCVITQRVADPVPDLHTFRTMLAYAEAETVQIKLALVDAGNVSFLAFSEPKDLL